VQGLTPDSLGPQARLWVQHGAALSSAAHEVAAEDEGVAGPGGALALPGWQPGWMNGRFAVPREVAAGDRSVIQPPVEVGVAAGSPLP